MKLQVAPLCCLQPACCPRGAVQDFTSREMMDDAAIIAAASDVMAKLFYVYANNQCDYHGALDVYRPQANALAAMQVPDGSLSMTHEATQHSKGTI